MRGSQSMKLNGPWEVRRTIKVPGLSRAADARQLELTLVEVPGVRQARAESERRRVRIIYDITGCDYQGLERLLRDAGFVPPDSWWTRLKSSWYQYADSTGRENANAPQSPCCNRPPRR